MGLEEVSLSQLDVYSASGWLDRIERAGNRLPDPATLFLLGTLVLMLLSQLAVWLDWQVQRDSSMEVETIRAVSLLDSAGIWWLLSNLVQNFVNFPPLGLVLVGLLGIGVSERSGLLPVLLRRVLAMAPRALLVPATVLVGVLSSLTLDAGYVVLPPLAGALFLAAGRSPLAGIAAVTSGVTCGFSANLFITGLDPLLAGLSTSAAVLLDPDYRVAITANWWFMIASTLLLTLLGTLVTTHIVEPRLGHQGVAEVAPEQTAQRASEDRGLRRAALMFLILSCLLLAAVLLPGAPLAGQGAHFPRWMEVLVPLLLILFLGIGLAYGIGAGTIRSDRDAVEMMSETMKTMGPYIVLAFFAAQFIACFDHSGLGAMLAIAGGDWLVQMQLPSTTLVLAFIALVMAGNLIMGSASAKYAFFAPVFVPMFMQVGISPELTQAAYRVGDSVTNGITPFNPYLVIILAFVRRYRPDAGLGTLLALMLPYTLVFAPVWSLLLGLWVMLGWPLGPAGPLVYTG
ncbi:MAG TPA: aminobenzoyl-glutamate transporter [Chromatiaceae bacterium]|jgi:aminobenzoyl-glutamate transport protein|nr:aminobenzoyl-glutamate transporter [Chromatiaceae bacterium]HCS91073.1 aminobenzoyl-glutamate transporter [Chromatiaceae bacterium]